MTFWGRHTKVKINTRCCLNGTNTWPDPLAFYYRMAYWLGFGIDRPEMGAGVSPGAAFSPVRYADVSARARGRILPWGAPRAAGGSSA